MRTYNAYFSFYSEEWGNFDDVIYKVQADSPYDARTEAWLKWSQCMDSKFQSCVKLYAITWEPNPLDAGDYFYSIAADTKMAMRRIDYVDIPNCRIQKRNQTEFYEKLKHYDLAALNKTDDIAKDLYADKGILPPSIYEELHYARELAYRLEFTQSKVLLDIIDQAAKWDVKGYKWDIRELFKNRYISLNNDTYYFQNQFDRKGVYPLYNDLNDTESKYVARWKNMKTVNALADLKPPQENDVIPQSNDFMAYDGHYLFIDTHQFLDVFDHPENRIWIPTGDITNITHDYSNAFIAENAITDNQIKFYRSDFLGVLRPDVTERYDFDALKREYVAHMIQQSVTPARMNGRHDDGLTAVESEVEESEFDDEI